VVVCADTLKPCSHVHVPIAVRKLGTDIDGARFSNRIQPRENDAMASDDDDSPSTLGMMSEADLEGMDLPSHLKRDIMRRWRVAGDVARVGVGMDADEDLDFDEQTEWRKAGAAAWIAAGLPRRDDEDGGKKAVARSLSLSPAPSPVKKMTGAALRGLDRGAVAASEDLGTPSKRNAARREARADDAIVLAALKAAEDERRKRAEATDAVVLAARVREDSVMRRERELKKAETAAAAAAAARAVAEAAADAERRVREIEDDTRRDAERARAAARDREARERAEAAKREEKRREDAVRAERETQVRSIHWSPYDRVRVVNAVS